MASALETEPSSDPPQTPSFSLQGKRALVVGASSGIGLACSFALARAGADLTLAARRSALIEEAAQDLRTEGWVAQAQALDISDLEATGRFLGESDPFDVVVNSAGLARHGPTLETRPEDFDAVIGVNLRGSYFLLREAAKRLIGASRGGSMVTISSMMGKIGGPERATYCATKHANEGFSKAMAIEWGKHDIRVNTICPGFIPTALTAPTLMRPELRAWIDKRISLNRLGRLEDIMGAVVFLASDASAYITGTSIMVDGGWTSG